MNQRFVLAVFASLSVLPVFAAVFYALLYSVELTGLLSNGLTYRHWQRALSSWSFWSSLGFSLGIALQVTIVGAVLGWGLAKGLGSRLDQWPFGRAALLPLAVPSVVIGLVTFAWFTASGWSNRWLAVLGVLQDPLDGPSWVQDPWGFGIILAHVYAASAFFTIAFRGIIRMEHIDRLEHVAASLGAGTIQTFVRITFPILLRRSLGTSSLVFMFTVGSYEIPLLLGPQSPQMLSVLVLEKFGQYDLHQKPEAMAVAVIYAILLTLGVHTVFHLMKEGPSE
ncbi:MAG: ABC transporter permease subunit [Myxococcota bacterium]